jgi:fructose-1,6-bisphosphatase/inositol monophosphatase family enzyme
MTSRLAFALEAAYAGGRSTLAHFQNGVAVDTKSDDSPVTVADRTAERIIREMIAKQYPNDFILGEEEGGDHTRPDRWIIDPIDGTKVFIAGVPFYSTLLSYEVDFKPIVGICFFPALGEMVYAETGSGAFFNGRPCRVSSRESISGGVITFSGPKRLRDHGLLDGVLSLSERAADERTWNDAYGHALVATGRVETMIDPAISLWDISALTLIVTEAGGRASGLDGLSPLIPNGPESTAPGKHDFITSNGRVHEEVLAALNH